MLKGQKKSSRFFWNANQRPTDLKRLHDTGRGCLMGVPSYQLTTNFSANCQLTTNFS